MENKNNKQDKVQKVCKSCGAKFTVSVFYTSGLCHDCNPYTEEESKAPEAWNITDVLDDIMPRYGRTEPVWYD